MHRVTCSSGHKHASVTLRVTGFGRRDSLTLRVTSSRQELRQPLSSITNSFFPVGLISSLICDVAGSP